MAKKRVSHQSQSQDLKQSQTVAPTMPMASPTSNSSVQVNNLKNLNVVFLKETTQRQQQIESLESTLHHSTMASDAFHLESVVISVFMENQVKEMNLCFDTLVREREHEVVTLKRKLSDLTTRLQHETSVLAQERDALVYRVQQLEETVNIERKFREEAKKLGLEGEELLSKKEKAIKELKNERDLALRSSQVSLSVIEMLKGEIDAVTREKNEMENINNTREKKIVALDLELKQLMESLKKEEELMHAKVGQLVENLGLAMQKEEEMVKEISALQREKKEMEKSVDILTKQKDSVNKVIDAVQRELRDKQYELDEAVRVSDEIEQVKVNYENEIVELRGEIDRLKESCKEFEEENKQLLLQLQHYRNYVDEVVLEKESIKKVFDEEKKKVEELQLMIPGTQEMVVRSDVELGQMGRERDKLVEKEKILEGHVNVLRKENDALQSMLVEARRVSEDLSAKVEVWCSNSNKALALLKIIAAIVCQHKDRGEEVVSDENLVEEIQSYAQELDAIKKAFESKDEMVDDIKQQLMILQTSVVQAHKSKSLWIVIFSATTIFSVVLAAYVARGR
ncbi:Laminin subunit alpha-2 [Spatholobus suberectus]|nr:Laminin subunit alpha-2 [Spatholobus suberectus]